MQYSPKLKKAMVQIEAILKENDIAGAVVLHTPGFSEYLNHVKTSYSCVTMEEDRMAIHLKEKEIGREKALALADGTFNMMHHLTANTVAQADMYMKCYDLLKEKWGGTDLGGGGHTSHRQQNN